MSCCDESQKKLCGLGANYRPSHCELNQPVVTSGYVQVEPLSQQPETVTTSTAPKGRDRAKYNAYMKRYMRERRAKARAEKNIVVEASKP